MKKQNLILVLLILSLFGVADSVYLTIEHFSGTIPPCTPGAFMVDCGEVLRSKYSEIFAIPLALFGAFHYSILSILSALLFLRDKRYAIYGVLILSTFGVIFSSYLVYLQLGVIKAICLYCMASALISLFIFVVAQIAFSEERKRLTVIKIQLIYKYLAKPIFFRIDSELIHDAMTGLGEGLGKVVGLKAANKYFFKHDFPQMRQKIRGIEFSNPIGLAAGFDYEARLTQFLPSLGFGFATVGTITNMPYAGNPKPRLGRLPKSRSLMVNKGFKSAGAKVVAERLEKLSFEFPVGVSLGSSNSTKITNQREAISDIVTAFNVFEKSKVKNSYYELNISCPNLIHGEKISFYPPKNLKELLRQVDKLKIKKPIFVKMPIEKSDKETIEMLEVIARHSPVGVILGNLLKDRSHPSLDKSEVKQFKMGNFSGRPTFKRSNELIKLTYKNYKGRFVIIGCGGIFNAVDAFEKIRLGATLVQFITEFSQILLQAPLITGMIYEGPQLAAQINLELADLLEQKGFKHINEAVGSNSL